MPIPPAPLHTTPCHEPKFNVIAFKSACTWEFFILFLYDGSVTLLLSAFRRCKYVLKAKSCWITIAVELHSYRYIYTSICVGPDLSNAQKLVFWSGLLCMDRPNWYASVGNEVSGKIFWKSFGCGGPKMKEGRWMKLKVFQNVSLCARWPQAELHFNKYFPQRRSVGRFPNIRAIVETECDRFSALTINFIWSGFSWVETKSINRRNPLPLMA